MEQVVDFALSSQEGHSKAEIPDDESTVNRFYHSVTYAYKFIDKGSKETSRLNVSFYFIFSFCPHVAWSFGNMTVNAHRIRHILNTHSVDILLGTPC